MASIKDLIGDIPLIAKFGYFTAAQQPLLEQIVLGSQPYLAAFSVINTIQAAVVDEHGKQLLPRRGAPKSGPLWRQYQMGWHGYGQTSACITQTAPPQLRNHRGRRSYAT